MVTGASFGPRTGELPTETSWTFPGSGPVGRRGSSLAERASTFSASRSTFVDSAASGVPDAPGPCANHQPAAKPAARRAVDRRAALIRARLGAFQRLLAAGDGPR